MLLSAPRGGSGLLNPEQILREEVEIFPGATVGDLGCGGSAYFTLQAARLVGENGIVYAVDILKGILSNVSTRAKMYGLKNVRTVWSNLELYGATKINDGALDIALMVTVLFQNQHPEAVMKEGARMTKRGGKILVIDWREGRFPLGPEPRKKILPDRVREITSALGLKEIKSFSAGQFHYGLIFQKS